MLAAPKSYGQSVIPDSLLYKEVDLSLMYYPSDPWTQGCDSIILSEFPGRTYYYHADSIIHLIATRPLSEIRHEVFYLYFIVKYSHPGIGEGILQKLIEAVDRYNSDALRREVDVMAAYCHFYSDDPGFGWGWDYFWKLVEKYERRGDLQTKMRIMQRLLYVSCGVQGQVVTKHIKRGIPVIKLINEILDTQQRLDKRGEYYMFGAAHFYLRVAFIYYFFKLYDKAAPLLWKAAAMPSNFYFDRSVMTARDYLGDYHWSQLKDYDRSDSLYLSIIHSPDRVIMRPLDNVVAFGTMAGNAYRRGQIDEAKRLYLAAFPLAVELNEKDQWLCFYYSLGLARIYLETDDMENARLWKERANNYYDNGRPRYNKDYRYYQLCRDYYIKTGDAAEAALYIDSLDQTEVREGNKFYTPILFNAHEQAYEAGLVLKEEQLRSERTRVVFVLIILAMSLLVSGILLYFYRKLQTKNRNLFNQIREQDLLATRNDALVRLPKADKADIAEEQANRRLHELFVRTRAYLLEDRNFLKADLDTIKMIADLSTNRLYLFEAIKTITGKTLQEYINDLRLEEAKRLLESTDEIIESISSKCGYSTVRTFYRLFGARYGMSPAVYRRLAKEEERVKS